MRLTSRCSPPFGGYWLRRRQSSQAVPPYLVPAVAAATSWLDCLFSSRDSSQPYLGTALFAAVCGVVRPVDQQVRRLCAEPGSEPPHPYKVNASGPLGRHSGGFQARFGCTATGRGQWSRCPRRCVVAGLGAARGMFGAPRGSLRRSGSLGFDKLVAISQAPASVPALSGYPAAAYTAFGDVAAGFIFYAVHHAFSVDPLLIVFATVHYTHTSANRRGAQGTSPWVSAGGVFSPHLHISGLRL